VPRIIPEATIGAFAMIELDGEAFRREALDVDQHGDEVPVPSFGPRLVCTYCGTIGCDARPNWAEQGSRMVTPFAPSD
jgi:hypothetical protein